MTSQTLAALEGFIAALNAKFNTIDGTTTGYVFSIDRPGIKFTRIVQRGVNGGLSRSVYCFVDADGNIYKAAGWKAPAKGVRSTLATVDVSKVDPYGSWLYR
jgi:hypothetical protein